MSSGALRRAPVIVGREDEAAFLAAAVSDARSGRPRCVVLTGEGGVGKTRLLAAVTEEARRHGLPVLAGRAPVAAPLPFSVVAEATRSWLRTQQQLPAPPPPLSAGLRLLLPEWPVDGAPGPRLSDGQLRLLALEALVWLAREVAAGRGAVFVLDDLHGADRDSLEAVRYLATAAPPHVLVTGALRAGEGSAAEEVVRRLERDAVADVVELDALGRASVADLLGALLDAEPPEELVADVFARTDGVPLLVEELLDAHLRAGSIDVGAGRITWRGVAPVVPRTIRDMVEARLERLPNPSREVLVAAAVVGDLDPSVLGEVTELPPPLVGDAIRDGVSGGLLESTQGTVGFRHPLVHEAVAASALPHAVATLHRRAADALARRDGANAETLERRARHLRAVGSDDEAATLLTSASTLRLREHALLGAESLAREAVAAARSSPAAEAASDALATVLAAQGRLAEAAALDDAANTAYGETADRWRRMAASAIEGGRPEMAANLLARAVAFGDGSPATTVVAGRLAMTTGDADTALGQAEATLAAALAVGDVATACTALDLKGRALDFLGRRTDAVDAWTEQANRAGAAGLTDARLRAVVLLAKLEVFDGRPPQRLHEAVELTRAAGAFVEQALAEENLAIALSLQGDPRAGAALAAEAAQRCRDLRLDMLPYLLIAQGGAESLAGDYGTAEALLHEAEALAPEDDLNMRLHLLGIRSDMALRAGRYDTAVALLGEAVETYRSLPGSMPTDSPAWFAAALAVVGRAQDAARALEFARSMPDPARWHGRPVVTAAAAALIERSPGGVDDAIASATGRMPSDLALIRVLAADALDAPQRARWLREALELYDAMGDRPSVDRVRRMLRDAGAPVPRRRQEAPVPAHLGAQGVTAREAEVLRLLGDGLSNADIAGHLYVSVRTVESHVSSLLSKLGVDGRGKLTAISASTDWTATT